MFSEGPVMGLTLRVIHSLLEASDVGCEESEDFPWKQEGDQAPVLPRHSAPQGFIDTFL